MIADLGWWYLEMCGVVWTHAVLLLPWWWVER